LKISIFALRVDSKKLKWGKQSCKKVKKKQKLKKMRVPGFAAT